MKLKNSSADTVVVRELGLYVEPGKEVEVADVHCTARKSANGHRIPSVIESLAPQLKPVSAGDKPRYRDGGSAPAKVPGPPRPTATQLEASGHAPGVAALLAEQASLDIEDDEPDFDEPSKGKGKKGK